MFPTRVEKNAIKPQQDKRNAQPLPHVECHAVLKRLLVLFQELDEEPEGEDASQAKAEKETSLALLALLFVQIKHDEEKNLLGIVRLPVFYAGMGAICPFVPAGRG